MKTSMRQQQVIASLLTGKSSISQLLNLPFFADITERTLQRDLNEMIDLGLVERQGEARAVRYIYSH